MTLGILSLLIPFIGIITAIIGIVISIISFKEIERKAETGKGLAISGLICSIIGIILQLFIIFALIVFLNFVSYSAI
nr:DUF4190 domain-containing protein [Virgibacillus sp. MSJ-26]